MGATLRIILLWFCGLCAAGQFAKFAVPFELVRLQYPDLGAQFGWLLSILSLIGALMGVVVGGFVGRLGLKRVLVVGMIVGALASFYQSFFPGFVPMLASRVLEGASHLAIVVAAPTLIGRLAPRKSLGLAMALWSSFFGVSFALFAWIGLPLAQSWGVQALFQAHAVFMAVCALLVMLAVSEITPQGATVRHGFLRSHLLAYRSAHIAAPGVGWLFYTLTFVSLLAVLPSRMDEDVAGLIAGLLPLVSIAVSLGLLPLILVRITSVPLIVAGFCLATFVVGAAASGLSWEIAALLLFAVLGLVQGASFTAVPELNPDAENQALAYGLMAQTGNTGNLLGTPLLLTALDWGGERSMMLGLMVIYGVAILLHVLMARMRNAAVTS